MENQIDIYLDRNAYKLDWNPMGSFGTQCGEMHRKKKTKEAQEQREKDKVESNEISALHFYHKWVKDGKSVRYNGYPELGENILISITNVLLARVGASGATYVKRPDYLNMKKC